jgi:2-dehydropantoate 2-reductase
MDDAVLIVGPGAIGLLLAARLRLAGVPVTLLDHRPDRAQRLTQISLQEHDQTRQIPITASADPGIAVHFKYILICVKAQTTAAVTRTIAPHVPVQACVLSLQNGLGNKETLAQLPCNSNLRVAVTSYGARLLNEHTVIPTGDGTIRIAAAATDQIAAQWTHHLEKAGFSVALAADVEVMLWSKLVINAALNPLTALYRLANGELPQHPQAWTQAIQILDESVHIATACGIELDADTMRRQLQDVCGKTASNQSSMLADVLAGKPTEIDAINGAIVNAATANGMPAKQNLAVIKLIHKLRDQ